MSAVLENKISGLDGQIFQTAPTSLYDINDFFKDNYKYIEALESEALILLAIAYKKKSYGKKKIENESNQPNTSNAIQDFDKLVCLSKDKLQKLLDNTTQKNSHHGKKKA